LKTGKNVNLIQGEIEQNGSGGNFLVCDSIEKKNIFGASASLSFVIE
jgi:large exoprotein involved in heme utilization and adhesion